MTDDVEQQPSEIVTEVFDALFPKPIKGVRWRQLSLSSTPQKLVLNRRDRLDTPHLTFSWGNRSGELDLHLTWEPRDGLPRRHQGLVRMKENDLTEKMEGLLALIGEQVSAAGLFSFLPPIEELDRDRFSVLWSHPADVVDALQGRLPVKRRKLTLPDVLPQEQQFIDAGVIDVYELELLDLLASEPALVDITPPMLLDGDAGTSFSLRLGADGRWLALHSQGLERSLMIQTLPVMLDLWDKVKDVYGAIYEAMELGDLGWDHPESVWFRERREVLQRALERGEDLELRDVYTDAYSTREPSEEVAND